jgi:hypothetical protein
MIKNPKSDERYGGNVKFSLYKFSKSSNSFTKVYICCLHVLFLSLVASGFAHASEYECAISVRLTFLQTTIVDVQRSSSEDLAVVFTTNGKYFTKSAKVFNSKDGSKKVSLLGAGTLEAALLENVGLKAILLLSDEVDGLIVGLFPEGGPGCVEGMLLTK